ncbi:universal stress protein [Oceanimonas baumannii]|uniref:Nucleotide-binding universal stress UspA family protein n=1 Tax=Oceanimonas baumannii TaxID=129578 RepID=A0A235CHE6_9GAMM|nr:universal stress protein [Oceanimonas baumannii]OYD24028.1 Usp domain-containing protein [Oceanimonas baumannii]TDW58677.1 nucleotide-binding universal stress UspA family protein [Oceanimonas baumannii]
MSINVLAGIDGSKYTACVSDYAAWAAQQLSASLVLLNVRHKPEPTLLYNMGAATSLSAQDKIHAELADLDKKRAELVRTQSQVLLEQASAHITQAGYPAPRTISREGRLTDVLAQYDDYADLVVLGRRGNNEDDNPERLGSHVEQVIRTTDKPLLLTDGDFRPPQRVMIAFDGSDTTRKCVDYIAKSPLFKGLECHLVMVAGPSEEKQLQLEAARQLLEDNGHQATAALLQGEVKKNLLAYQEKQNMDVMVMGAYGHSRIRLWLLGSITNLILQESHKPMLILR